MKAEFPQIDYVHGPGGFRKLPLTGLLVPRDGHPNALAHKSYAELIWPFLKQAVRAKSPTAGQFAPRRLAAGTIFADGHQARK
jgi:hypothetical protein